MSLVRGASPFEKGPAAMNSSPITAPPLSPQFLVTHAASTAVLVLLFVIIQRLTFPYLRPLQKVGLFALVFFWYFSAFFISPDAIRIAHVLQFCAIGLWGGMILLFVQRKPPEALTNTSSQVSSNHNSDSQELPEHAPFFSAKPIREQDLVQAQLSRAAHLASIGKLASGIAHEINNPLAVLMGYIRIMDKRADRLSPKELRETLAKQKLAAERIAEIIKRVQAFANPHPAPPQPTSVERCLKNAMEFFDSKCKNANISLSLVVEGQPNALSFVSAPQIEQAFLSLLTNAFEASKTSAQKNIDIDILSNTQTITVRIGDSGPGIPEKIANRIFEPFFTTKPLGENVGLGLCVVENIVQRARGRIAFENKTTGGVNFVIELPRFTETTSN